MQKHARMRSEAKHVLMIRPLLLRHSHTSFSDIDTATYCPADCTLTPSIRKRHHCSWRTTDTTLPDLRQDSSRARFVVSAKSQLFDILRFVAPLSATNQSTARIGPFESTFVAHYSPRCSPAPLQQQDSFSLRRASMPSTRKTLSLKPCLAAGTISSPAEAIPFSD